MDVVLLDAVRIRFEHLIGAALEARRSACQEPPDRNRAGDFPDALVGESQMRLSPE